MTFIPATDAQKLRSGMRVRCQIGRSPVNDAKLRFHEGRWFICNNVRNGRILPAALRYGYEYSWALGESYHPLIKQLSAEHVTRFYIQYPLCPKEAL